MKPAQQPMACKNGHEFCLQCISVLIGPQSPTWGWDLACKMPGGGYILLKEFDNQLFDLGRRLGMVRWFAIYVRSKFVAYAAVKRDTLNDGDASWKLEYPQQIFAEMLEGCRQLFDTANSLCVDDVDQLEVRLHDVQLTSRIISDFIADNSASRRTRSTSKAAADMHELIAGHASTACGTWAQIRQRLRPMMEKHGDFQQQLNNLMIALPNDDTVLKLAQFGEMLSSQLMADAFDLVRDADAVLRAVAHCVLQLQSRRRDVERLLERLHQRQQQEAFFSASCSDTIAAYIICPMCRHAGPFLPVTPAAEANV